MGGSRLIVQAGLVLRAPLPGLRGQALVDPGGAGVPGVSLVGGAFPAPV
jgi:hypothetical protein